VGFTVSTTKLLGLAFSMRGDRMCQGQPFTAIKMRSAQRLSKCRSFPGSAAVSVVVVK